MSSLGDASGRGDMFPRDWVSRTAAPPTPGPCVIFDLDGVLSDAAGRQHFLEGPGWQDWDAFFEACGDDPLVSETAMLLQLLDPQLGIVLLTARPRRVLSETLSWLTRYRLRWDLLIMRQHGDYSRAYEYKHHSLARLRRLGWEVRLAFEDDPRNLAMFRGEGVPCVYIHSGYYE